MIRSEKTTQVSRTLMIVLGFVGLIGSTGCAARVYGGGYSRVYVEPAPVVFTEAPELVYVEPGVYVVRNYGQAVYYSDGYYWCYQNGGWYSTSYWGDPWVSVHVNVVPSVFVYRDHRTYVHYHGGAGATVYRAPTRTYHTASASAHVGAHAGAGAGAPPGPPAPNSGSASIHGNGQVVSHRPSSPSAAPDSASARSPRPHGSAGFDADGRTAQRGVDSSPRVSGYSPDPSSSSRSPRSSSSPAPASRGGSVSAPQPARSAPAARQSQPQPRASQPAPARAPKSEAAPARASKSSKKKSSSR